MEEPIDFWNRQPTLGTSPTCGAKPGKVRMGVPVATGHFEPVEPRFEWLLGPSNHRFTVEI